MPRPAFAAVFAVSCLFAGPTLAQEVRPTSATAPAGLSSPEQANPVWVRPAQLPLTPDTPKRSPLRALGADFGRFFAASDSGRLLATFGTLALAGHEFDRQTRRAARAWGGAAFTAGNIGGGTPAQLGLAFGTWAFGKALGAPQATAVGADLLSAQIVTQTVVQGLKYSVGRPRPDQSNQRSFPSGHTASSFATATVLQRHFGWKVGVPAYAFGAYVAAARVASDKHYLSDVLMGAGIGLVAGRAVTVELRRQRFALGVAPTTGGAAITFTRK